MEELRENLRALQSMHEEGLLDASELRAMKAQHLREYAQRERPGFYH